VNRRIVVVLATAIVVVVAALAVQRWTNRVQGSPAPAPALVPAVAVEGTDADAAFALRIRAESAVYRSGEPIHIRAWLTYLGPKQQEGLAGSGDGLVGFSWEEQLGRRHQGAVWHSSCVGYSIDRGKALAVPFAKSGGFSGEDPDADYWRQFFADPVFRLPVGRYRIHAETNFWIGDCGHPAPEHHLDAAVEITVLP
jgi:hypothetical protein